MTSEQAARLVPILARRGGYEIRSQTEGQGFFCLGQDTSSGYISIKPDFAMHLLEVSLPPRRNEEELRALLQQTLRVLDESLAEAGLYRDERSIVSDPGARFELAEVGRLRGYVEQFPARSETSAELYFPHYPALIASTHVHLNVPLDRSLGLMQFMYELEWLAIRLFSKSYFFDGREYGCARVLLYEDSLGESYRLKTVPEKVPTTLDEYVAAFNSSPAYFSADPFFPVRDLSFIRPRHFGTLEFRSACSQSRVEEILDVAAFRVLQLGYSLSRARRGSVSDPGVARRAMLRQARLKSAVLGQFERKALENVERGLSDLPRWIADRIGQKILGELR
jgi:hypothetical protein